ncbi:hypothetical protein CUN63_02800 [Pseudomonas sp. ACM7]|nr:hypothetical protein CUN63_02800 [Pseudomonas sp. ACM7]
MMVCSGGVVVGAGADVTPRIFYENFIAVMVNIDGNYRKDEAPHASMAQPRPCSPTRLADDGNVPRAHSSTDSVRFARSARYVPAIRTPELRRCRDRSGTGALRNPLPLHRR